MLISRQRYKTETYFQWKTNRKSYVAYRMAPVLVTLNGLEGHSRLQAFSSAIRRSFVLYFTRFQLTACSRGPSVTAGLLVFISEVALVWKKDYFRKTACIWLCDYDAAFVKLLWPLVTGGTGFVTAICPFCHIIISVKARQETQSTNSNQHTGFILSSLTTGFLMDTGTASFTATLQCWHSNIHCPS